jgi:tetratricopeptide (TPR) repeat protein
MEKEAVLETLESRLRDNPKSLLFARLADAYLAQGKIDDGMILCTEGVKYHPYYSTGYFVLAKAHLLKKEYDKAESMLKKVLSHDQQYLAAHKMLADILVKTGWEATAVDHYAAVLDIDPFEEKIRDLMKRYGSKPEPKTPLLKPSEDPATAAEEAFPPVELKPPAPPRDEPAAETLPPFRPETEFPALPDWTDEIREFHPDDGNPPGADKSKKPPVASPAADERLTANPPVVEPDPIFFPEEDLFAAAASGPAAAPESAPVNEAGPPASGEDMVDFTQDWFDLSSFETPEEESPREIRPAVEIVGTDPAPAGSVPVESSGGALFEKNEPREILTPSDLRAHEPPEEAPPAPPVRTKPPAAFRKSPEIETPHDVRSQSAEEPKPPVIKGPPVPSKSEDKPELKIVTSTLGEIYAVQGQFDKAIQVYEALLEKTPGDQKYLDKIADLKKKMRDASGK